MKSKLLISAATVVLVLGASLASANDNEDLSSKPATIELAPADSLPMTAEELENTRGEAVLKWVKKTCWGVPCGVYPTIEYVRYTYKDRYGNQKTYTRNH